MRTLSSRSARSRGSAQKGRHSSSWSHALALLRQPRSAPTVRGGESTDTSAMEETTGSTAGTKLAAAELALSDEQRGRIYEGVMRIQDASVAYEPAPAVADALPSAVPLQDLPAGIAREIPPVQATNS